MRSLSAFEKKYVAGLPKQVGDSVSLKKNVNFDSFWFTNISKNAKQNLEDGVKYKIKTIIPASSWTAVIFEEFPDFEFNYHWFE